MGSRCGGTEGDTSARVIVLWSDVVAAMSHVVQAKT